MDAIYLLAAVLLSLAALAVAIASDLRTRRATRALARELVQLRDLIRSGEIGAGSEIPQSGGDTAAHTLAEVLTPRVERLERRLADALEIPATMSGAGVPDAEPQILRALRRKGYANAVILESLEDGRVRVEAERDGMTVKGLARVGEDGSVEIAAVSSARAFP